MALRPCLDCGALVADGPRCPTHRRQRGRIRNAARNPRTHAVYDGAWERLRRAMIAAQPWCSRCGATERLSLDHVVPLARGGASDASNVQVLCLRCNSSKAAR